MDNNEKMPEEKKVETPAIQPQEPAFNQTVVNSIPTEYKPISMWGYLGYQLLFAIPCIGLILLCVFAFGGTSNINLKNFARSYLCLILIGVLITVVFVAIFGISLGAFGAAGGFDPSSFGNSAVESSSYVG